MDLIYRSYSARRWGWVIHRLYGLALVLVIFFILAWVQRVLSIGLFVLMKKVV